MRSPSEHYYLITTWLGGMIIDPSKKHSSFVYFYVVLKTLLTSLYLLLSFVYLLSDSPFVDKLASSQFFLSTLHITIRHYNTLLRAKEVSKMMIRLDTIWKEGIAEGIMANDYKKQDDKTKKYIMIFNVTFLGLCPLIIVEWLFKNWNKEIWTFPINSFLPFPNSWYWSNFLVQLASFSCAVMSCGASVGNLFILTSYSAFTLKVLQRLLVQKDVKHLGSRPYLLYQEIIKHNGEMNSFLGTVYFIQMIINGIEVASRVFTCFVDINRGVFSNLLSYVLLTFLTLTTPYILNWGGSQITTENEQLFRAVYESSWRKNDVKTRKELIILTTMASKPMRLNYRLAFTFEMEKFGTFLQGVYSYIMLLQHFGTDGGL